MRGLIEGIGLSTENMVYHMEKLWFTEIDNNKLYYYDLKARETVHYYTFKKEIKDRLFCCSLIVDNWLICIPFNASGIYMIEMCTQDVKYIPITEKDLDVEKCNEILPKFMDAVRYNNSIYMIGTFYPVIVEYNISLDKLSYYDGWQNDVSKHFNSQENALVRKCVVVGEKLYAPFCKASAILEFDMDNHGFKIHQVGDKTCNYSAACYDGSDLWLAPRNAGGIVRWNLEDKKYYIYSQYPEELSRTSCSFNGIYCDENQNIVLVPGTSNMYLIYDKQNEKIFEYDRELRGFGHVSMCRGDEEQYMFSIDENLLLIQSKNGCEYFNLKNNENISGNFSIPESRKETLITYIDNFKRDKKEDFVSAIGGNIWKRVRI